MLRIELHPAALVAALATITPPLSDADARATSAPRPPARADRRDAFLAMLRMTLEATAGR